MLFDTPRSRPGGSRWLTRRPSAWAQTVLYCVPTAGFGPDQYLGWPASARGIEVCPLRFPGDEEPSWWDKNPGLADRAADLAAELADAMRARSGPTGDPYADRCSPRRPRGPQRYALFAHGASALIAYEAVAELERLGGPAPCRLFVSGCPAPHRARVDAAPPDERTMERAVLAACVETGGVPLASRLEASMRAASAEAKALAVYHPSAPTLSATPVTAIGWPRCPGSGYESMADWSDCASADFEALDGGEYEYVVNPAALLEALVARLTPRDLRTEA